MDAVHQLGRQVQNDLAGPTVASLRDHAGLGELAWIATMSGTSFMRDVPSLLNNAQVIQMDENEKQLADLIVRV
jgi:hypothetical protein